jgi:hypothetical protein
MVNSDLAKTEYIRVWLNDKGNESRTLWARDRSVSVYLSKPAAIGRWARSVAGSPLRAATIC